MSDTTDRAGESVLGTLLAYYTPELVTVVQARGIGWRDFGPERQQAVYRAILRLHAGGAHVDVLTVEALLSKHGWLERAGGPGYLAVCVHAAVPSAIKDHAFIVAEGGRWTRLFAAWEMLGNAVRAQDDERLREAAALVHRNVLPDEAPKLRVVRGAA